MTDACGCDDEYGPCEEHGEVIVQREGASTRTADDLALLYCEDAVELLREQTGEDRVSPWGVQVMAEAEQNLGANDHYGCRWFSEDVAEGLADALDTLADQLSCELSTLDVPHFTYWDDGYRIVKVLGGPLVD